MAEFSYTAKNQRGQTVQGVMTANNEMELAGLLKREKSHYLLKSRVIPTKSSSGANEALGTTMTEFSYTAKNQQGQTVEGVITANDEMELASLLKREKSQYLLTNRVIPTKRSSGANETKGATATSSFGRLKRSDLSAFFYNVSALVSGGIPLPDALLESAARSERPKVRALIEDLHAKILEGSLLSEAMAQHPTSFSTTYVNIVQVGETTGNLPSVLDDMLRSLEWEEEVAGEVKQAVAYPIMVISIVAAIWIFLMTFVVPRMVDMLDSLRVPLPAITQFTIQMSAFLREYWYLILGGIIAVIIGYRMFYSTPSGRLIVDRIKLSLPIFGEVTRKLAYSTFAHYLALLYGAGIGIVQALELVEKVIKNRVIAQGIGEAKEQIVQGVPLVKALEASRDMPAVVLQMLRIGETTGKLDEALQRVCVFYDRETKTVIKQMLAVVQPALIVHIPISLLWF